MKRFWGLLWVGLWFSLVAAGQRPDSISHQTQETILYFPDYVEGEGWSVQLALSNLDTSESAEVEVRAYSQDGGRVRDLFSGDSRVRISPLGSQLLRSTQGTTIRRGWIQIHSASSSVSGLLTYGHTETGIEVGVEPVELGGHFALFVEESTDIGTGLAIYKPEADSQIEFQFRDEAGQDPLGEDVQWGDFRQRAGVLSEWLQGSDQSFLRDFRGLLLLEADEGASFTPLGLRFGKRQGSLSAVPVIPLLGAGQGGDGGPPNPFEFGGGGTGSEGLLYFPDYVEGEGWSVQLALSNLDTAATAEGEVEVYDQSGGRIRNLFDSSTSLEIPPLGSRVLRSTQGTTIRRGWIQVRSRTGAVRGLLTYRHAQTGIEVGVKPVPLGGRFALFVEESTDIGTGLAIYKPEADSQIEFQFRDEAGQDPLGEDVQWGDFRQRAGVLSEWLQGADQTFLRDFRGLLLLEADEGASFAPLGLRFGKRQGSLSAVPVIPIGDDHANDRSGATLLALNSSLAGEIETSRDEDWFRVETSGLRHLRVRTTGSLDTVGTLFDASGRQLAEDDDGGSGNNFALEAGVPAGVYYVRVRGYDEDETGSYTIEEHGEADDHANDRSGATLLALNSSLAGEIETSRDEDWFRVETSGRRHLRVRTTGSLDTVGTLFDASGQRLASDDDSGSSANFALEAEVPAGVYYVRVRGYDEDETGSYTIEEHGEPAGGGGGGGEDSPPDLVFTKHVIDVDIRDIDVLYGLDVDADGDLDILSGGENASSVHWHENNGGVFTSRLIFSAGSGRRVYPADVDGDGDADVLLAAWHEDKIAWHENDGSGAFEERVISTNADGATSVHAADLDGDGDQDVLSASRGDNKIAWYENDGGVFEERVISTDAYGATWVRAADLDGDGDADVLAADLDKIAWYENDGGTVEGERVISAGRYTFVHAVDVDGDGDADVLSGSLWDDKIAWHENLGGGAFSAQRLVTTDADQLESVDAADLDGDGDADVLSASYLDQKIAWHKNDAGVFKERVISTVMYPGAVGAADLDGDGDPDVLSASDSRGEGLVWHENLSDHGDDHGDTPDDAMLVTALSAFLHGTLESAGDRDVFRVATGTGTLRAYSNGPTDTVGRLLDAAGELLAENDDAGGDSNFEVEIQVAAGVHYVEVRGYADNTTGPYTLSIEFVER